MKKMGLYAAAGLVGVVVISVLGFWGRASESLDSRPSSLVEAGAAKRSPPAIMTSWLMIPHLNNLDGPKAHGELGGTDVTLTLDVSLQRQLKQQLSTGRVLRGGSVLLEIPSGRILAAAGHSEASPPGDNAAFESFAPSASIFKIVTASALLHAGVSKDERVCYHGGKRRMKPSQLKNNKRRDWRCTTLFQTVPRSQNVAIAKLALKYLDYDALMAEASLLGFNRPLLTHWMTDISTVTVPEGDDFELARTCAGFDGVKLSALHAAAIAATIANGGIWVQPRLENGDESPILPRVMTQKNATILKQMMVATTTTGTAKWHFARQKHALKGVTIAGKTGSLTDYEAKIHTSWFVGFAPADNPQVAVAVAILNDMDIWYIEAIETARRALEAFFARDRPQSDQKRKIGVWQHTKSVRENVIKEQCLAEK